MNFSEDRVKPSYFDHVFVVWDHCASGCKISLLELGKPREGMRNVRESNIQFAHVSRNILFDNQ